MRHAEIYVFPVLVGERREIQPGQGDVHALALFQYPPRRHLAGQGIAADRFYFKRYIAVVNVDEMAFFYDLEGAVVVERDFTMSVRLVGLYKLYLQPFFEFKRRFKAADAYAVPLEVLHYEYMPAHFSVEFTHKSDLGGVLFICPVREVQPHGVQPSGVELAQHGRGRAGRAESGQYFCLWAAERFEHDKLYKNTGKPAIKKQPPFTGPDWSSTKRRLFPL